MTAADAGRQANTIILDAAGVQNLRIQTVMAEVGDFEETVFSLGRIEAKQGNIGVVASGISGRIVGITALPGDRVAANTEVLRVESRQPGNAPPVIGLRVPLGGTVTRLEVRLGEPVEPDRPLLEITDLSEVLAIARVPEHLAGRLPAGTVAHIRISAVPDKVFDGRLLRFGTAADPASGTLDAIFVLPNTEGYFRPGMRAEFSVVVARRANITRVPRSALQGEPANRFVYVKDFDLPNAFVKTPVVVGEANDRFVEIVSGLFPADEVVTQGGYSLAFAGSGTVSLKEALDAAHGHEHNPDGSEMTAEQKKQAAAGPAGAVAPGSDGRATFWMITSAVLAVLLLAVGFRPRAAAASVDGK